MRLKNKKTGEIVIANVTRVVSGVDFDCGQTLAELNAEWEDVPEEPKKTWFIDAFGNIRDREAMTLKSGWDDKPLFEFETKKEAKLAVRKLKAWKRLRDKGFRIKTWEWEYIYDDNISGVLTIKAHIDDATDSNGKYTKDLDLLFGGEE